MLQGDMIAIIVSSIFSFGFLLGAWVVCRTAQLSLVKTLFAAVLSRAGSAHQCKPTELLFFPDSGMPCNSYYDGKRCWKLQRNERCTFLHPGERSSLMKVMDTMKYADQIDLCMFRFTLEKVADLFERLHYQGKRIRIITDSSHDAIDNNQIPRLKRCGIEVRESRLDPDINDRSRPLMHNKFVIVDRKCCILGSFNWTHHGVTKNSETVIKSYEPTVVGPLLKKFEEMWRNLGARRY